MHPNLLSSNDKEEVENDICSNGLPGLEPRRPQRLRRPCKLYFRNKLQQNLPNVSRGHSQRIRPTPFKLQVANGDIETPTKTIILQFEIGDWNFKETFIVAKRLTGPILGLTFLKNNSAILDVSQGLLHFPHLTYSIETDEYTRNRRLYKVQIKNSLTIPPETTQTITAYTDISSTIDTTGVINPATNHCSSDPWS